MATESDECIPNLANHSIGEFDIMKNMEDIAIALGGNIGDVSESFQKAVALLKENGVKDIIVSSLYANLADNCIPGTPDFTNAALIGGWGKSPQELLLLCKQIETTLGRPKEHTSNTSRIIDLDIILFGSQIINEPGLHIPHRRAHKRLFVLIPLAEIAPNWVFPGKNLSVKNMLNQKEM